MTTPLSPREINEILFGKLTIGGEDIELHGPISIVFYAAEDAKVDQSGKVLGLKPRAE